ncbi:hypothetical protein GDO81_024640 [Engystomops pustulosus]|uniref:Uncharacterized protein n=1 Tax=Engystomops pustulosus TaxID=76066 RepID=A0AAV6Z4Y4_ENGPU|nr:hypothetical protein GDO81_024640 [Engystomops pustulosus]
MRLRTYAIRVRRCPHLLAIFFPGQHWWWVTLYSAQEGGIFSQADSRGDRLEDKVWRTLHHCAVLANIDCDCSKRFADVVYGPADVLTAVLEG